MGVVVRDQRAGGDQQICEGDAGRLADVRRVLLVRDAKHGDVSAVEGLVLLVEQAVDSAQNVLRHAGVDASGQLDELGVDVHLAGLPGQVERIDRNAMSAQTRPRLEWHVAEWLRCARVDHFPDIDPETVTDRLKLVDESDVDDPEDVLEELRDLSGSKAGHRHELVDESAVEGDGQVQAIPREPRNDLGSVTYVPRGVSRVDAFGRVADENVLAWD